LAAGVLGSNRKPLLLMLTVVARPRHD
jgi:hypothetical protein